MGCWSQPGIVQLRALPRGFVFQCDRGMEHFDVPRLRSWESFGDRGGKYERRVPSVWSWKVQLAAVSVL